MREQGTAPVSLKSLWTLRKQNGCWQNSSDTLSSEKTILKPPEHVIRICSRHRSQIRARSKPVILHMLGSAGALPGRNEWFLGKAVLASAATYSEASRLSTWCAWGTPLGFYPLRVLVLSLTHLVWSSSSYLLLTVTFRKLLASASSTINMGMIVPYTYFFFFFFFWWWRVENTVDCAWKVLGT